MTSNSKQLDLPQVALETYIILPFQIAPGKAGQAFTADKFRAHLQGSAWKKADNIHDPDDIAKQGLDDAALKRIRYQAYNYFHPFVRSFWYDSNLVQRFRHQKLSTLRTEIGTVGSISFDAAADLYHFMPDIGVLVLHLKAQQTLPLAHAQECLDRLRRIYPPYIAGTNDSCLEAGHFPASVELLDAQGKSLGHYTNEQLGVLIRNAQACEEKQSCANEKECPDHQLLLTHSHILAAHWAELLKPLGDGEYQIQQLGDDRAALVSKIDLQPIPGIPTNKLVDRGNMIRLCFADARGNDRLPYAQRYLAQFEERFCYDRFWYLDGESDDAPSRIMNSGYAFTWLGAANDSRYFADNFAGAPVAFRHIYVPMAIIAHFQKAALLVASRRLADLSPYGSNGIPAKLNSEEFQAMEANFIAFTQTYWFNEITPQEQGIELFDMWRRELRLPALYQEHRQELQDIVAFINGREEALQSEAANELNHYALRFAMAALIVAYISMLAGVMGMNSFEIDFLSGFDVEIKALGLIAFAVLLA
ncbi:MAG: hypothetical protein PHV02_19525, partial [Rhodocyclaceae bacterium]|nr:hypothetical protein [Rhodocyclaceae bacterium]